MEKGVGIGKAGGWHENEDGMKTEWDEKRTENIPEGSFSPNAQVLQNEPDAHVAVWIGEFEGTDTETAD